MLIWYSAPDPDVDLAGQVEPHCIFMQERALATMLQHLIPDGYKSANKLKQTQKNTSFCCTCRQHTAAQGMTFIDWLIVPACT